MNSTEAIKHLTGIANRLAEFKKSVTRKRSWRKSEQAMAIVSYDYEIEAINLAIAAIKNGVGNDRPV